MEKIHFYVLIGLFLLVFSLFSQADTNTGWPCTTNQSCQEDLGEDGESYYCNTTLGACFLVRQAAPSPPPPRSVSNVSVVVSPALEARVGTLEATVTTTRNDVSLLNTDVGAIASDVGVIRSDITSIQRQVAQVSNDISTLSQDIAALRTELAPRIDQAISGFAVLQDNLNSTQVELGVIEQSLAKERAFTKFLTYFFFTLLVLAIALGVIYYVTKKPMEMNQQIIEYITKYVKKGEKFPSIRERLRKAGWADEDITLAYKETVKQNYQRYLQQKSTPLKSERPALQSATPAQKAPAPIQLGSDKSKIISISIVSILLIIGVIFLLSGTVGQAIFLTKAVNTTGEILYGISCTPPHILNPAGDACCLDQNNNTRCDLDERQVEQVAQGERCTDNLQCGLGELCIDGNCGSLASLYLGSPICDQLCNYYAVEISTSDGETYNVAPRKGSYTAAGALEWRILQGQTHCKGEAPVVPINIIRKEPGKILNEEIITLRRGQTSKTLTHPDLPQLSFTLTMDSVKELCS